MNIVAFYENRGKFTGGFLKNLAQNIENARSPPKQPNLSKTKTKSQGRMQIFTENYQEF